MIHVMPLSSIARITKMDIETLEELSKTNPVFASGANFFYELGGVEEIITELPEMKKAIHRHIEEVYDLTKQGRTKELGPWGRGIIGAQRGGRKTREQVLERMEQEFAKIEKDYV